MNIFRLIAVLFLLIIVSLAGYYFYPEKALPTNRPVDKLLVYKSKRLMLVYSDGEFLKSYKISLGAEPVGKKEYQGDGKTPEGVYLINDKSPISKYHKNLGISYPCDNDIQRASSHGRRAGGDIKIHGLPNNLGFIGKFQRFYDWTSGCIAITDQEIDELYLAVKIGTLIEIKP